MFKKVKDDEKLLDVKEKYGVVEAKVNGLEEEDVDEDVFCFVLYFVF
jgi:hypothetical protein